MFFGISGRFGGTSIVEDNLCAYRAETADGITIIRFSRPPTSADIIEAVNELAERGCSSLRLWDVRAGLNFTPNEARILAGVLDGKINLPGSRYAVLVTSTHDFGMARLFDTYYEVDGVEGDVFQDEQEAIAWLKKDRQLFAID